MTAPQLAGRPVILIHLADPPGSGLTACSGDPFTLEQQTDTAYPLVPCPGCIHAERRLETRVALRALHRAITDEGPHPEHHRRIMARHRQEWPQLWRVIDVLRGVR